MNGTCGTHHRDRRDVVSWCTGWFGTPFRLDDGDLDDDANEDDEFEDEDSNGDDDEDEEDDEDVPETWQVH
jgi:hypothetical protein